MKKADIAKYIVRAYWKARFAENQSDALVGSKLYDTSVATPLQLKEDFRVFRDLFNDVLEEMQNDDRSSEES